MLMLISVPVGIYLIASGLLGLGVDALDHVAGKHESKFEKYVWKAIAKLCIGVALLLYFIGGLVQ